MDIIHHTVMGGIGFSLLASGSREVAAAAFLAASVLPDPDVFFIDLFCWIMTGIACAAIFFGWALPAGTAYFVLLLFYFLFKEMRAITKYFHITDVLAYPSPLLKKASNSFLCGLFVLTDRRY